MPMTKKSSASAKGTGEEGLQDGWARFERAVDAAVKSGPKHKLKAKAKQSSSDVPSGADKSKRRSK